MQKRGSMKHDRPRFAVEVAKAKLDVLFRVSEPEPEFAEPASAPQKQLISEAQQCLAIAPDADPDGVEVHNVRVHIFSNGTSMELCLRCRYGKGFLSEGIGVNRLPHTFNRHANDWRGYTKRHQVSDGKQLVIVRHETKSEPVDNPACIVSKELGSVISARESQLAIKASTDQVERENTIRALADVSRQQDAGTRRNAREYLINPSAFNHVVEIWSAEGIPHPTAPNSDHKAKLLERGTAQQGYGEDGTEAAWRYILKTHGSFVCLEWRQYPRFVQDMGCKPSTGHILCRFKNRGTFNKSNCRWMTRKQARIEGLGLLGLKI